MWEGSDTEREREREVERKQMIKGAKVPVETGEKSGWGALGWGRRGDIFP